MNEVVSLCKRRGIIFQSSELYGGIGSIWDYGPIGVELKRNVRNLWWQYMVKEREDVFGVDTAIIMHPNVWKASGHLQNFNDLLAECSNCHRRTRVESKEQNSCHNCGSELGLPKKFNLMFETNIGPTQDSASKVYLRPETAQGIFVNFENVRAAVRKPLPFGIAQIGKSFRNEITPGNFTFRMREFEQMEMEFFCKESEDNYWYNYWIDFSKQWFCKLGINPDNLRLRHHDVNELPHYAKSSADLEYRFPWGWGEIETIANRTNYDLESHTKHSDKDMSYYDDTTKERFFPFVIEPAMGLDRAILAFIIDAYDQDMPMNEKRLVLRFHPDVAPIQLTVLPLSRNEELRPYAKMVYNKLKPIFNCQYDDTQSIGRRYRRQDEIGTPLCVTIDFKTVQEDDAVTIRNRDTMKQIRVPTEHLVASVAQELQNMRE